MQTTRTDFNAGFEMLGLNSKLSADYDNAHDFSKRFKKCTALTQVNVSYSSNSASVSLQAEAAQAK
ncbi:hypothetical protein LO767_18555 [Halopseudomonas aestusnigri]|uniref:hypothetical protein n=1 Tax=Halopseudomonas aestusnigri TaxID=857252 RepID=UPI001E40E482|nr:hypothetical protein [Halopseudomonas aestusnigri]UGV30919.1 hypothetical protein LO767_18555 [Halopseudomonas aestusnigri]